MARSPALFMATAVQSRGLVPSIHYGRESGAPEEGNLFNVLRRFEHLLAMTN
jgi:hypothetical protein